MIFARIICEDDTKRTFLESNIAEISSSEDIPSLEKFLLVLTKQHLAQHLLCRFNFATVVSHVLGVC